jgi:hypothetical protein
LEQNCSTPERGAPSKRRTGAGVLICKKLSTVILNPASSVKDLLLRDAAKQQIPRMKPLGMICMEGSLLFRRFTVYLICRRSKRRTSAGVSICENLLTVILNPASSGEGSAFRDASTSRPLA